MYLYLSFFYSFLIKSVFTSIQLIFPQCEDIVCLPTSLQWSKAATIFAAQAGSNIFATWFFTIARLILPFFTWRTHTTFNILTFIYYLIPIKFSDRPNTCIMFITQPRSHCKHISLELENISDLNTCG